MVLEPAFLNLWSLHWAGNTAPYGIQTATQATVILGPKEYNVSVYDAALSPALEFQLYDYYDNYIPVDGTTSLTTTIPADEEYNCFGQFPYLAGSDTASSGVAMSNGTAYFTDLLAYCAPLGNITLEFEARLGDLYGLTRGQAEVYYIKTRVFLRFRSCIEGEKVTVRECVTWVICANCRYD